MENIGFPSLFRWGITRILSDSAFLATKSSKYGKKSNLTIGTIFWDALFCINRNILYLCKLDSGKQKRQTVRLLALAVTPKGFEPSS